MRLDRLLVPSLLALLAACGDNPTEHGGQPGDLSLYVSGGAQDGFYFLRPTLPSAPEVFPGVFDPNRQPVVQIVCTTVTHQRCPVVARFDRAGTGTGRVNVEKDRYGADWQDPRILQLGRDKYRLVVTEGTTILGQADLWVVQTTADLKQVTSSYLGVARGATFKIRFRIETTAGTPVVVDTVVVAPDSAVVGTGQTSQLVAIPRDASGNPIVGRVASWATADPAIAAVSATGLVTAIGPGKVKVSATVDGKTGTGTIVVADQLPGLPTDPAATAIQRKTPAVNLAEYDRNHPALTGFLVSFTTAVISTTPAATIADVNAVLADFQATVLGGLPGIAGKAGNLLYVRFKTSNHAEMDAVIAQLRSRPYLASAVADHEVGPTSIPRSDVPLLWTWGLQPADANWGMESIRAPALWNLNDFVKKSGRRTPTGVFDVGFTNVHEDLTFAVNQTPTALHDHGTHVAGTIGATFDNGIGVDGVNPFAAMNVYGIGTSTWSQIISQFCIFLLDPPVPTVVNISLGYNWYLAGINTATNPTARNTAASDGQVVTDCLQIISQNRALPIIVAAAGNDDGQDATWATPWTAAAFLNNAGPIIVVEATDVASAPVLAPFSNVNGHLSAPGVAILSTMQSQKYGSMQGTSMAAPHVTGLIGYLLALAPSLPPPTMHTNLIRDLLMRTGEIGVGAAANEIDAFEAALETDQLLGGNQVVRALADFDDGTPDGNRRVTPQGAVDSLQDHDGDGGMGDGQVDMADFRRFRDWLLDIEKPNGLSLDGPQNLVKRDQNLDHEYWSSVLDESEYSRGDLNGDGVINRAGQAAIGGIFHGRQVTDLDVLMEVFNDPLYTKAELPGLLDSGDITVDATACLAVPNAASVDIAIQINSDTTRIVRRHKYAPTDPVAVFTVPLDPAGYAIRVAALDASDAVLATATTTDSVVALGGDIYYQARCGTATVTIAPDMNTVARGYQVQYSASVSGVANTAVTWSATGGTISPTGLYTAGSAVGIFQVTATSVADPNAKASDLFQIIIPTAVPPPSLAITRMGGTPQTLGRFRVSVVNVPGVDIKWSLRAVSTFAGDVTGSVVTAIEPPVQFDTFTMHWFFDANIPSTWPPRSDITITVTASAFRNGQPLLNTFGVPIQLNEIWIP